MTRKTRPARYGSHRKQHRRRRRLAAAVRLRRHVIPRVRTRRSMRRRTKLCVANTRNRLFRRRGRRYNIRIYILRVRART